MNRITTLRSPVVAPLSERRVQDCIVRAAWFSAILAGLLAFSLSYGTVANAESATARVAKEYTVKAAYLFNFTRYLTWPPTAFSAPEAPFIVGVFGQAPPELREALSVFQEKKRAQGRPIVIRYLADARQAPACHLVFVRNTSSDADSRAVILACKSAPALTVGESDNFVNEGGCVCFLLDDGHVRFQLSLAATKAKNLRPDARLLRVGEVVE